MVVVKGTYENGVVTFEEEIKTNKPVKVSVTFLEDVETNSKNRVTMDSFSFRETRHLLRNLTTSLSDDLINERRG